MSSWTVTRCLRTGAALAALYLLGCGGEKTEFSQASPRGKGPPPEAIDASAEANVKLGDPQTYRFTLSQEAQDSSPIVRNGPVTVSPAIFFNDAAKSLEGEELARWDVAVDRKERVADAARGEVKPTVIDLSEASGTVVLEAHFAQAGSSREGHASLALFVDDEPPKPTLIALGPGADEGSLSIYYAAADNYGLNEAASALVACLDSVADFSLDAAEDLAKLPEGCEVQLSGAEVHELPARTMLTEGRIGGARHAAAGLRWLLFLEDRVGYGASTWMTRATESRATLALAGAVTNAVYTRSQVVTLPLELTRILRGEETALHDAAHADEWLLYGLQVTRTGEATREQDFESPVTLDLGNVDGPVGYEFKVTERASGIQSNVYVAHYVLDRAAPVVGDVKIEVVGGVLEANATVNVSWVVGETSPVTGQTVEISFDKGATWVKLSSVDPEKERYAFPWGDRPTTSSFRVRVTVTDAAGNTGTGEASPWIPQIFNAAVLTRSVECFFCHLRIEGDVGGINFPSEIHYDSGQNLDIMGRLFATNTVPPCIYRENGQIAARRDNCMKTPVHQGIFENYRNTGTRIFPRDTTGDGVPDFPALVSGDLTPRMTGTLRQGNLFINRVLKKDLLVLDGSDRDEPIRIAGEVFIDGDLVIKGYYTGIGTIYARNVYVVDDIVALDSPFPYPADEAGAIAKAKEDIKAHKDGLYLGALNQLLVGDTDNNLLVTESPFQWIQKAVFEALGPQAAPLKNNDGSDFGLIGAQIVNPRTDGRVNLEVNRVDAYLYAQNVIIWRSYANLLINGGFMGPRAALVASYPYRLWASHGRIDGPMNPRNGLFSKQNVIRYDYRLKVGGAGFETLKMFFDNQE